MHNTPHGFDAEPPTDRIEAIQPEWPYRNDEFPAGIHRLGDMALREPAEPTPETPPYIGSPEYVAVAALSANLMVTGGYLDWRYMGRQPAPDSILGAGSTPESASLFMHLRHLKDQGLDLDVRLAEKARSSGNYEDAAKLGGDLRTHVEGSLREVRRTGLLLQERRDLTFGGKIKVRRSPDEQNPSGRVEAGWTLEGIDASGRFIVTRSTPEGDYHKIIHRDSLVEVNPGPANQAGPRGPRR